VEFTASSLSDSTFSRYYIFISSIPTGYSDAMAVKQKFIDTGQLHLSDAKDNDDDYKTDEEVFDGVDNDGDGEIDEDINLMPEKVVTTKGDNTVQVVLTTFAHGKPLQDGVTYWVVVLQTDRFCNESEADFSDATEPTIGDSFSAAVAGLPTPNNPPYCSIISPTGWKGGTFDISAQASDPDNAYGDKVSLVEFYYSTSSLNGPWYYIGTKFLTTDAPSTGTYTYSWNSAEDLPDVEDSSVWLRARSRDSNGHSYSDWSVSSSFGIDNKAPGIPSPDDGIDASGTKWTNQNNITMTWGAISDSGSGIKDYLYHYDAFEDSSTTGLSHTEILSDGSHMFYVVARDSAGNISPSYGTHQVNIDTTKPNTTTVDAPERVFNSLTISWSSVSDPSPGSGVKYYKIYRDLSSIDNNTERDALTPISTTTATSFTDEGLTPGVTYYYVVCAYDNAGNEADVSNCVSEWAGNEPVLGDCWHIAHSTFSVTTTSPNTYTHYYRELSTGVPAAIVKRGDTVTIYQANRYKDVIPEPDEAVGNQTYNDTRIYWKRSDDTSWNEGTVAFYNPDNETWPDIYFNSTGIKYYEHKIYVDRPGGTTFYYYIKVTYTTGGDPDNEFTSYPYRDTTYLYDPYGTGVSSKTAFESEAQAQPFSFYVSNTAPPKPTLISPNGGEILQAGDVWTIKWSTVSDVDGDTVYYDIDYTFDGGITWNGITKAATGGSFNWDVPASESPNCLVRIRAYDGSEYSDFDESNSTFTIKGEIADHLVISEVCVGWATGQSTLEYIELYNPTDSDIDLKNYPSNGKVCSIMSTTKTGDILENLLSSSAGVWINQVIPAKGYFLICSEASINGVSADADHAKNLTGADGIQLKDGDGNIIDMVAWGTKNTGDIPNCTETERASSDTDLDNGWAIERKAFSDSTASSMAPGGADNNKGNGYDSDNNAFDFVVHKDTNSFTPQNSSSSIEPPEDTTVPTLSGGGVSPSEGTTAKTFSFTVTYTDLGNDRPTYAKVFIDGDEGHDMTTSDEVFDNGSEFIYQTTLSEGTHNYYFYFSDGKYFVRYPETGVLTGPNVGPNLTTIEILRQPDGNTPVENEIITPGTVTFDIKLTGSDGTGDADGYSDFEARLKYRINGGDWITVDMTSSDGMYFTASANFSSGDCVEYYFEGRDNDSTLWDTTTDESYFTVELVNAWHYPTTPFTDPNLFPQTYRYPAQPDETQTVTIYAGCEDNTAQFSLYYAVNGLPQMSADGTPLSGTQKIDLDWDFEISTGTDRLGDYFSTRPSSSPIPVQPEDSIVYYFIKVNVSGKPTTYILSDGNSPEGTLLSSYLPDDSS
ncbi:hypothetical protein DRQ17_07240, partial [bacterium]